MTVNLYKLHKVKKILKAKNDSETIRLLIDKELALQSALKANQSFREAGGSNPILWR